MFNITDMSFPREVVFNNQPASCLILTCDAMVSKLIITSNQTITQSVIQIIKNLHNLTIL